MPKLNCRSLSFAAMSEIVSLSLSSEDEMVSHLCKFLRLGDIAPGKVCNASGMCLESVSRMSALVLHPAFASWQRRVAHEFRFREIAHACMPCGSGHDNSAFDATAVATEVGVRAMLEMFTESGAVSGGGSTPFVQWIDSIAFSSRGSQVVAIPCITSKFLQHSAHAE